MISSVPSDSLAFYLTNALTALIPTFTSIFSNHNGSKNPNPVLIEDVNVIYDTTVSETNPNPVIRLTYRDDGVENTVSVPVDVKQSVLYEPQLTEDRAIILNGIHDTEHYIDSTSNYASFFDENTIRIIHDGLMRIFNHEENNTPKEGFINIVKEILLSSMRLDENDPNYIHIMKNVDDGMGDFRFQEFNKQAANRAAKVANLLKYVYDNTGIAKVTSHFMKEWIQELPTLIGDYIQQIIPISKGGQRPKQSYNYAHFIPLKPQGKKSFHDSKSRKVKGRRRKQSRNKHTTRRK